MIHKINCSRISLGHSGTRHKVIRLVALVTGQWPHTLLHICSTLYTKIIIVNNMETVGTSDPTRFLLLKWIFLCFMLFFFTVLISTDEIEMIYLRQQIIWNKNLIDSHIKQERKQFTKVQSYGLTRRIFTHRWYLQLFWSDWFMLVYIKWTTEEYRFINFETNIAYQNQWWE